MIKRNLKGVVTEALEANDLEAVVSLAKENRRILSLLVRMAYDKDTLVGWRAIKAVGLVARALAQTDHDFLREGVRKLLWMLTDESGGIGWSAPELLGEIVSADPQRFNDIIPLIAEVYDIEEDVFRPGVLYAMGKIAEVSPDLVMPFKELVRRALSDGVPLQCVYALDLLKTLKDRLGRDDLDNLKKIMQGHLSTDNSEAWVYTNDCFACVVVGEYVRATLNQYFT